MGKSPGISTSKAAPGRYSLVEREILRCAAIGETADFTGPRWRRAKAVAGKPVVAGKFLSDLWLGTLPVDVHPLGIKISGVHIEGEVSVCGASTAGGQRQALPRFNVKQSVFANGLDVSESRCETFYATDCVFHQLPPGEFFEEGDVLCAVNCSGTQFVGMLGLLRCTIDGRLDLQNSVIDDDLAVLECTVAASLDCLNAEVRGLINIFRTQFRDRAGAATSVSLIGTECRSLVMFCECGISGSLEISQLNAESLYLDRVAVRKGGIACAGATISNGVSIQRCRTDGPLSLHRLRTVGGVSIASTTVGRRAQPANVDLQGVEADFVSIEKCMISGAIQASNAHCRSSFVLSDLRVGSDPADLYSVRADHLTACNLAIVNCFASGHIGCVQVHCASLHLADLYIGVTGPARRLLSGRLADVAANQPEMFGKLFFPLATVTGTAVIERVAALGAADFASAKVGAVLTFKNCWFGTADLPSSLGANGVRVGNIFNLTDCLMPGGIDICASEIGDVQIYGSRISQGSSATRISASSIWASESRFVRAFSIGRSPQSDSKGWDSHLDGMVDLRSASVGGYASFSGAMIRHRVSDATQVTASLDLSDSRIPALMLGIGRKRGSRHEGPLAFSGAVVADGAEIGVIYLGDDLSLGAQPVEKEQVSSLHGEAVVTHKRGVAFSGRALKVMRFMRLREFQVAGLIDLRDAEICNLQDQGGAGWRTAGVAPGQLLLDGLSYAGLDDDEGTAETGSARQRTLAVSRRLAWLDLQYPGGAPTAASFTPQPYEQLASHYAADGDERARRQVLVRKRQLQRFHSGLGWAERQVSGLLGLTSDYGYSPGKASLWTFALLVLGTLAAWALHAAGGVVPATDEAAQRLFSAPLYAIDVAIPFIEFGHDESWRIDPTRVAGFWGRDNVIPLLEALYRLASFVLLSITVLTFSGVLRDKD